jgi:formate hydrogenlyase subunit 6/NADH:ubiquinone oxidoreductase subunit I
MTGWARDVWDGVRTTLIGMRITWRHLFTRSATLQYPEEKWQLPPKSRMRLFMKYEDCIGCGQCVRACPVSCIYLKADKRDPKTAAIFAADGTPIKLDVKVFDIDMSLCCYCNLCTYPCPTNCIYMTPEYEFAATELTQHLYHFAKPNAKFLTVNPKAASKPAPTVTKAPAAPGSATTAAAPSPGTEPKPVPPPTGTPANNPPPQVPPQPPSAGPLPKPPKPDPEPSGA